jgi:HAD superfamily hydrolase (TIGR01450 family)
VLLIVDLDGVVYRGRRPIAGVPELLRTRDALGDVIVYATNNSSIHRADLVTLLEGMGAPVSAERIVTSARATAIYLSERRPRVRRVLVFGGPGLRQELRDAGIRVLAPTPVGLARHPDAVAVGIDRGLTYGRLATAADAVRGGATFIATNRDPVYPAPDGLQPGAGAVVAALEVASGRSPIVIGKPEPGLFEVAAHIAGVSPSAAVVVGDSLVTDVAAANRIGARSVLMLTGVSTAAQVEAAPPSQRPTAVAADAEGLAAVLERFSREG